MRLNALAAIFFVILGADSSHALQKKGIPKPATPTRVSKNWETSSKTDAMNDVTSFDASIRGDAGLLSIGCKKGQRDSFTVLVGSDKFLGGNRVGMRELTYRLDNQSPVQGRWAYSGRAAMLTNTEQSVELLIPLMKSKNLLIRMYSYDGASQDIKYDVTGAGETIRKLMSDCQIVSH